jgi:lipopolysaccharide export system ATP-binding protein
MIINQNSQLRTHGPSRTEIRQEPSNDQAKEKKREAKKAAAQAAPAQAAPAQSVPAAALPTTMSIQTASVAIPKRAPAVAPKPQAVLMTDQLVKIYGGRAVVDGVNMNVRAGEIVGLLGPNGAGKTTSFT